MPLDRKQAERFMRIKHHCDEKGIEGIFTTGGGGLSADEMAYRLWRDGYLPFPTVEAMLEALEDSCVREKPRFAQYVFRWECQFVLSNPQNVPVPPRDVQDLREYIKEWADRRGLEATELEARARMPDECQSGGDND